jgi:GNAT superfamily N-acetyltransferase
MATPDSELYYICQPTTEPRPVALPIEFWTVQEFLSSEPDCRRLWELISTQFRTRHKFLSIWPGVRFACVHRNANGELDGVLLITAPVNWQIDYVVVAPESRGHGIASALVVAAVNEAGRREVPYLMLTSKASLRPLYEGCGFRAIAEKDALRLVAQAS